jgi:hypothetical protein
MVPIDIEKRVEFDFDSPVVDSINDDRSGSNYWFAILNPENEYKITTQRNIPGLLLARNREVGELFVFPNDSLLSLTKEKAYIVARDLELEYLFVYHRIGSNPLPYKVNK